MLYNEFVEGTGCKDNEHNYKVYKELEIIYMNTDCTKDHIYEMGKKLVDNSKSEAELRVEAEIKEQITGHKAEIEQAQKWIEDNKYFAEYWEGQGDKEMTDFYRRPIRRWREEIKYHKTKIRELKWILSN